MGVLSTAIASPRHVRAFVERQRLIDLLDAVDESRVTTVCAPAGYGKTTAALYWSRELRSRGRVVLWLALRAGIVDLADFTAALASAVAASGLSPAGPFCNLPLGEVIGVLAAGHQQRPVMIIDDAQLLSAETFELISTIVASARDALTTIIVSRNRSTVPVARLRSLGCLLEVGPADLRFSVADAARFVTMNDSRPIEATLLQRLVHDTRGWAGGIVMAGNMHRREWSFSGDGEFRPSGLNRDFEAYFEEEVLRLQPAAIRDFLIDSAVLDELTPAACAAVTQHEHGRRILETVEECGLFVEASDPERGSYRYHPLFREMVLRRLNDRDPARAMRLHCRASAHFADIGNWLRAVDHAEQSGDRAFLADQLDALAEPLTYNGLLYRLDELGSSLLPALLTGRPMLLLALAWRRIRSLAFNSAETLIAMAADAVATLQATGSATDMWLDHLRRLVEHRRILLLAARDDMLGVERRAEKLLAEFGDDQPYLSCALLAQLMASRRELYHFHDTLRLEAETRRALQRPGSDFASIALKSSVAPTLMAQGKMMAAEAMLEEALTLARSTQATRPELAALPALPLAELHYDQSNLRRARLLVDEHLPLVRHWGFTDQIAAGHIVNARLLVANGQVNEALTALDEAHLVAIECGLGRLRAVTVAEQVRILLKIGQLKDAEAAFRAGDLKEETEPFPTLTPTRQNESVAIAWLRLEIHNNRLARARKVAKRWSDFVRRTGAIRSVVVFELLLAEIAVLAGTQSEARRAAREAVSLAAASNWTQIFLDEGPSINALLTDAYAQGPALESAPDRFAARLVAMFNGGPAVRAQEEVGLDGRLVSRELDILAMVGGGLRNREIGDRLGLTEGTVKWYMQQIYDKLGVRRRPQAVMRARQLGIMS